MPSYKPWISVCNFSKFEKDLRRHRSQAVEIGTKFEVFRPTSATTVRMTAVTSLLLALRRKRFYFLWRNYHVDDSAQPGIGVACRSLPFRHAGVERRFPLDEQP